MRNLLPNEVLTVSAVDAADQVWPVGSQGVRSTSAAVNLPRLPLETQELRVSVSLCDRSLGYITVQVSNDLGAYTPLTVAPLYECATQVTVIGARPGALLTVHLNQHTNALANPLIADSDVVTITLWAPLIAGQSVQVTQFGCRADGSSRPEPVLSVPSPVPVPVIATPVLNDATAVAVSNLLPGAQLVLSIDGIPALLATADQWTSSISLAAGALANARFVAVAQQLCGKVSLETDGPPGLVNVQKAAPKPARGLARNSGYYFHNSCRDLAGVTAEIDVTEAVGGGGQPYTGFGFQLNCWSGVWPASTPCSSSPSRTTRTVTRRPPSGPRSSACRPAGPPGSPRAASSLRPWPR